jgi:hypothetical protein
MLSNSRENKVKFYNTWLPDEITHYIFGLLNYKQLASITTVSKQFHFFANKKEVWRLTLKNSFDIKHNIEMNLESFSKNLTRQIQKLIKLYKSLGQCFAVGDSPVEFDEITFKQVVKNPLTPLNKTNRYFYDHPYPIEAAASCGWEEMLLYLLMKGHHLIPTCRKNLLQRAIMSKKSNSVEMVRYLINFGISVTECALSIKSMDSWPRNGKITLFNSFAGLCPLAEAIRNDAVDIAKLLIESGATVDDLSYVHPKDKDDYKEWQRTVTQLIKAGELTLSPDMRRVIDKAEYYKSLATEKGKPYGQLITDEQSSMLEYLEMKYEIFYEKVEERKPSF